MLKNQHQVKYFERSGRQHECKLKKLIMSAFFSSQFPYCPRAWMFGSRQLNRKINRLHERCLCTF